MGRRGWTTMAALTAALALGACENNSNRGTGEQHDEADGVIPPGAIPAAPSQMPGVGTQPEGAMGPASGAGASDTTTSAGPRGPGSVPDSASRDSATTR